MLDWIENNWRWLHWVMWAVAAAILFIVGTCSHSYAAECLPSASAVWDAHRGAHATWSMRHGEKCWYVRTERKVMPLVSGQRTRSHDTRPRSAHLLAGAVPIPRAMPFELTKERELEALIPFNERWAGLGLSWR